MSQTVVALPRLIELRSLYSKKLLRYVKEEGKVKGFVQFRGEHVGSADAKFEVHSSKTGNGLVHIRSCYNNKYLRLLDKNTSWIAATAEKPEEDQSKHSCTLLRPTSVDGNPKTIRLTNVHNGNYLSMIPSYYYACVFAISVPDTYSRDVFNVIDWQSLVLLPKYVAFKGDNDKFLRALWFQNHSYLQFSATNVEDDPMLVGNEIVQTSDGNICIRNMHWNKYWRLSPNWIWADSTVSTSNDTVFEPVKYNDDTIALRNVANKLFCTRLTTEGKESCLNAGSPSINMWAKFKVSELVISKKIQNIKFRLMDSRIYDECMLVMVSSSYANHGNTTQEHTIELSYSNKKSSTWNSSLSMKSSVEASYTAGIPLIQEGKVTVGFEIAGQYMWGETTAAEEKISSIYKLSIPPKTKVTVRIMATRGVCDVPFSYDQRDVLYTGETVITGMDDGVYTGVNNYSFYTEQKEEPLNQNLSIATAGRTRPEKLDDPSQLKFCTQL